MHGFAALTLLLLFAGTSCSPRQPRLVKLPSHRTIAVLQEPSPVKLGDGTVLLAMSYRTHRKVTDTQALRSEVEEVWTLFRPAVEGLSYKAAAIQATEVSSRSGALPFMSFEFSNSKQFVFTRAADGAWTCLCDQPPAPKP